MESEKKSCGATFIQLVEMMQFELESREKIKAITVLCFV